MAASFPETAISTERLLLRPLADEDAPGLVAMMDDEPVHTWTAIPQPFTRAHATDWIRTLAPARRAEGRGIAFAVTEHLTQRLVGVVELRGTDWRLRSTEASCITAAWARGEGYAPEALLGVAQWLFEDRGFLRLELRTAAGNTAAQQVAQKIGCISEGVLRSAWIVRGGDWTAPTRTPAGAGPGPGSAGPGTPEDSVGSEGSVGSVGSEGESRSDLILWSLLPEDLESAQDDSWARQRYVLRD